MTGCYVSVTHVSHVQSWLFRVLWRGCLSTCVICYYDITYGVYEGEVLAAQCECLVWCSFESIEVLCNKERKIGM